MRVKQGKGGWFAIKIDLEKAFDRLRWEFIKETLEDARIPATLVMMIMNCITSPSMQVLSHGKPSMPFNSMRGIRQGDPLSPLLFVMAVEGVRKILNHTNSIGITKGVPLENNSTQISLLQFAEDTLIFLPY